MKTFGKILSIVLAICLCSVSVCTLFASAETTVLGVGDTTVEAGATYSFTAEEDGWYFFSAEGEGVGRYGLLLEGVAFEDGICDVTLRAGESVDFRVDGTGSVVVTVFRYVDNGDGDGDGDDEEVFLMVGENTVEAGATYQFIAGWVGTYTFQVIGTGDYTLTDGLGITIEDDTVETTAMGESFYLTINGKGSVTVIIEYTENEGELEISDEILMVGENTVYAGWIYQFVAGWTGTYTFQVIGTGDYTLTDVFGNEYEDVVEASAMGETFYLTINGKGTVDVLIDFEPVDGELEIADDVLMVGENTVYAGWIYQFVAGWTGTYTFQVVGTGDYTLTDVFGNEYEDVVEASAMGEIFYLAINGKGTVDVLIDFEPADSELEVSDEILMVGENTVYAGWIYQFIAGWTGTYTFQVIGTGDYTLTDVYGNEYEDVVEASAMGEIFYLAINGKGTVDVLIDFEPVDSELEISDEILMVGENTVYAGWIYQFIAGWTGTYTFQVIGTGDYTLTDVYGNEYEDVVEASAMGEIFYLAINGKGTVDVLIEYNEEGKELEIADEPVVVGDNEVYAGWIYQFIAPSAGVFNFQVIGSGDYVIKNAFGIEIEDDTVVASAIGEVFYIELNGKGSVIITISEGGELVVEPIQLVVGENKDVTVSGDGVEAVIVATKPGRYTISGEGVNVGVAIPDGVDWEVNYIDVTEAGQEIVFVVASDDFSTKTVTLTVNVASNDEPTVPPTGDAGWILFALLGVIALAGAAVVIKVRH